MVLTVSALFFPCKELVGEARLAGAYWPLAVLRHPLHPYPNPLKLLKQETRAFGSRFLL